MFCVDSALWTSCNCFLMWFSTANVNWTELLSICTFLFHVLCMKTLLKCSASWLHSFNSTVFVIKFLICRQNAPEAFFISVLFKVCGLWICPQSMDVLDGRRAPFPRHRFSGETRDTDTQAPSSGDSSPLPSSPEHGSPYSTEDTDKGGTRFDSSLREYEYVAALTHSFFFLPRQCMLFTAPKIYHLAQTQQQLHV